MKVGILGLGAIGTFLARELDALPSIEGILGYDPMPAKAEALRDLKKFRSAAAKQVVEGSDVVVEAASQEAVREYGETVLAAGKPFVVLSVGALADEAFVAKLLDLCHRKGGKLLVPSGAIGGLDVLAAAKLAGLDEVELESHKPPRALGVKALKPTVLFEGDASEAVRRFPTTINVAATLALAGLGAKRTRVRVIVDPKATGNMHIVRARGGFGRMELMFDNVPHPDNPRTSMLAAYSTLALLRNYFNALHVGT